MRTNIVLDDNLVDEAFQYAGNVKTKRELIKIALEEYVARHKMKDLRKIRGQIKFSDGYDYKSMRID